MPSKKLIQRRIKFKRLNERQLFSLMETIRQNERDGLNVLPYSVAFQLQTGYLLGYADCYNKVWKALTEEVKK